MSEKIIGFQGKLGANSDLVCRNYFRNYKSKSYQTFDEIFTAVNNEEIDVGIIPIENTYAGRVSEVHNLLRDTPLYITGEYFQNINHCLVAQHSSDKSLITDVYSHPQALMQCRKKISQLNLIPHQFINTANAAKYISEQQDPSKAAICNEVAAKIYDLQIIDNKFSDITNNTTIFISLSKNQLPDSQIKKSSITTILFTIRNIPGAIYKALGSFANNNINILKLESYIPGGDSTKAEFFISFVGSLKAQKVVNALEELNIYSSQIKVLGNYNAAPERNLKN